MMPFLDLNAHYHLERSLIPAHSHLTYCWLDLFFAFVVD